MYNDSMKWSLLLVGIISFAVIIALAIQISNQQGKSIPAPVASASITLSPQPSTSSDTEPEQNITVTQPLNGEVVTLPVTIRGQARTFESSVSMRVENENGQTVLQTFTTADAPDVGQFGPYEFILPAEDQNLQKLTGQTITIVVYENSARDGSEINVVKVPVIIGNK
jgi:hypothetical protein